MKGKQLAMDSALADLDRYEKERIYREQTEKINRLDEKYERMDYRKMNKHEYPAGSVVIIGQQLFREGVQRMHFYRTVLNYYKAHAGYIQEIFVEDTNEEYPERPPWADTVGHEGERRDIHLSQFMIYWFTGETVEPIRTWWLDAYEMEEWRG